MWFGDGKVCVPGVVFLVLSILYPNNTLTGFAKATKTGQAAKWYWRPLNSKRSLPVSKWSSESESFKKNFFAESTVVSV